MKQTNRIQSTLIYLVLGFLPLASSLLLTPIYTAFLTPDEYGLIALSGILQLWLSLLLSLSLDTAFSRFYFDNPGKEKINELLSTLLISILGIALMLSIILYFTGNTILETIFNSNRFTFSQFGWPVLLTAVFGVSYTIVSQFFRDSENLRSFSLLAVIYFLALTGFTFYGVVILKAGAEGSVYGKMAGTILTMAIYIVYIFSQTGIHFNASLIQRMLAFSMPLMLYGILAAAFDTMDRFFLEKYFDLTLLGQYNFAFVIASVIGIVIASFQSAVNPAAYRMLLDNANDHRKDLDALMKKFIWTALVFSSMCMLLAWILITFFINEQYHNSLRFIPLLSLSFIPRAYYIVYSYPLFSSNKTKVLPVINLFSVIAGILSNLIFIPLFGVTGIALSVVVIKTVQAAGARYFSAKFDLPAFRMKEVHRCSIYFCILAVTATLMSHKHTFYPALLFFMFASILFLTWKYNKSSLRFSL